MIKGARLVLLMLALVALAACRSSGDVRDKDGSEPAELPEIQDPLPVQRKWSVNTGAGTDRSRPHFRLQAHEGLIWTADHKGQITAVNASSGRVERRLSTGLPLSGGPTIAGDIILAGTFDGRAVALDAKSGETRWSTRLSSEVLSAPVLHDGMVVVRCIDGRVFGLDMADGKRVWVHDRSVPLLTLRGNSNPLTRAGRVYIGYDDGQVTALNVSDGSMLWSQRISAPEGRTELDRLADIDGPMQVVGSELYAVNYQGRLAGLALESGRIMWVKDMSSATGVELRRTSLAVADSDDRLWLVDRRNGATQWSSEKLLNRRLTRPVFLGALIAVADFEGYLHFVDSSGGEPVARTRASKKAPAAAPLVAGDSLYLLDEDGRLSAWQIGDRR
ncbi:MAG TPA: outer membrane protein assembly factor BamB [Wenzhouxiangella sp.]|nr:outer membrane protein assembly factor BamB [Wenzhouxiangella sp.]